MMTIMTTVTMMPMPTVVTALECSDTATLLRFGVRSAGNMNGEGLACCAGDLLLVFRGSQLGEIPTP